MPICASALGCALSRRPRRGGLLRVSLVVAWFEVFLGGRWHIFDARNNVPRIGRVLIGRGRDATDVPLSTTFGPNILKSFKVWTDEVQP